MSYRLATRCAAEGAGTAVLVGIGTGAIVAGARGPADPQAVLAVAWFVAVAVPVLAVAYVSGAHLNPAITLALWIVRRVPSADVGPYVASQVAGAFAGSLAVLAVLGTGAHLGATVPRGGALWLVVLLEAPFTAALVGSVLYLTRPATRPRRLALLLPAAVVGLSTYTIGPWTGSSLNPARSLAPAVLSGDYAGLWAYLLVVPISAALVAIGAKMVGDPAQLGPPVLEPAPKE